MDHGSKREDEEDCTAAAPLLRGEAYWKEERAHQRRHACFDLWRRVWEESRKLWEIVGPAIFTRTATYSLNVIMQALRRPPRRPGASIRLLRLHRASRLQLRPHGEFVRPFVPLHPW